MTTAAEHATEARSAGGLLPPRLASNSGLRELFPCRSEPLKGANIPVATRFLSHQSIADAANRLNRVSAKGSVDLLT